MYKSTKKYLIDQNRKNFYIDQNDYNGQNYQNHQNETNFFETRLDKKVKF